MTGKRPLINTDQTYVKALGLKKSPFEPDPDRNFYYSFRALEQRIGLLRGLMASQDVLILVIGDRGIGKTTFLKRYLDTNRVECQVCRIRTNAIDCREPPAVSQYLKEPVYILQDESHRTVIIDDAHLLEPGTLKKFLEKLSSGEQRGKVNRLLLIGEPQLSANLTSLNQALDDDIAVSRVFIPVLTQAETAAYLGHRLSVAGASNPRMFSRRAAKRLYRSTGGLPGQINAAANDWLRKRAKLALPPASDGKPTGIGPLRRFLKDFTAAGEMLSVSTLFHKNPSENHPISTQMVSSAPALKNEIKAGRIRVSPSAEYRNESAPAFDQNPGIVIRRNIAFNVPATTRTSPSIPMKPKSAGQTGATQHDIYRENWLLCLDPACYTVQVLGARSEKAIAAIVKTHRFPPHHQIACFRTIYKGENAYPLLWGVYRTRSEASAAVDDLPDKLKGFFPLIRRISTIQQAIHANKSP